jgi:hypothetical protein
VNSWSQNSTELGELDEQQEDSDGRRVTDGANIISEAES